MTLRPYQQQAYDAIMAWVSKCVDPCLIEAATGCHEKGHPILMHDGSIMPVEQVSVGDMVMGPDSKPRTVIKLHRGEQEMFRIIPVKGDSFVVNRDHILSLTTTKKRKNSQNEIKNISVYEYINAKNYTRHISKI